MRTVSPKACRLDGSPTMQQSTRSPRSTRRSTTRRVPSTDRPSSSLVMTKAIAPGWLGRSRRRCPQPSPWPRRRSSCRRRPARTGGRRATTGSNGFDVPLLERARSARRRCGRQSTGSARAAAADRPEVVDVVESQVLDGKPERFESGGDQLLAAAVLRRNRLAAYQLFRELESFGHPRDFTVTVAAARPTRGRRGRDPADARPRNFAAGTRSRAPELLRRSLGCPARLAARNRPVTTVASIRGAARASRRWRSPSGA